jgi:hypothetical protein
MPEPEIAIEVQKDQRGHFNVIHRDTGFKADFYTGGRDELHALAFRRARQMEYRGEPVNVAPPECVIVRFSGSDATVWLRKNKKIQRG